MKLWVGVTDKNWFDLLAARNSGEANFWQPSGSRNFKLLQPGEPFLFKLHSPNNFIVGGGFFVRYSPLPVSLAWEAFGEDNGVRTQSELLARVRRYRRDDVQLDPVIGCNVLAETFFLPRSQWIPAPRDWAMNIVQGKTYDTSTEIGAELWQRVRLAMPASTNLRDAAVEQGPDEKSRYGQPFLARGRLGQGAFRVLVTDAYQRRCAVTGEKTLPVLEAAHIKPYAEQGPHRIENGILLRSDLHKLFDLGYVTVTPDLTLLVSRRLKDEWHNGKEYYAHHGCQLMIQPESAAERPSVDYLSWHNENRFRE